jgi:hypothetical protein
MAAVVRKIPQVRSRVVYATATKAEARLVSSRAWVAQILNRTQTWLQRVEADALAADDAEVARLRASGLYSFDVNAILTPERRSAFDEMALAESPA